MIKIKFMKPFYTKTYGSKLRLVFAYQYFSITKDEEIFHFIPIEAKEIIINLETKQVENMSDVFVFQRGNRFIRLPLYQLMLISNVNEFIMPIIDGEVKEVLHNSKDESISEDESIIKDVDFEANFNTIIEELELMNIINYTNYHIDLALENNDKDAFYELSNKLNKLLTKS